MTDMTVNEVFSQAQQLSPQDRLHLIELLLSSLQADITPRSDWHEFLRETYGSTRDTPIQRWKQSEYEERAPVE